MPEADKSFERSKLIPANSDSEQRVYREYTYMVQVFSEPGTSWAGGYGPKGMQEGRMAGGVLTAFSVDDAKEQLNVLYESPSKYRLIELNARQAVDLS